MSKKFLGAGSETQKLFDASTGCHRSLGGGIDGS